LSSKYSWVIFGVVLYFCNHNLNWSSNYVFIFDSRMLRSNICESLWLLECGAVKQWEMTSLLCAHILPANRAFQNRKSGWSTCICARRRLYVKERLLTINGEFFSLFSWFNHHLFRYLTIYALWWKFLLYLDAMKKCQHHYLIVQGNFVGLLGMAIVYLEHCHIF